MSKQLNVAIAGATGLVGSTTLALLEQRNFPINQLFLLASQRSAGEKIYFKGIAHKVEDIANFDFSQTQLCFFATGNPISAEYAPKAAALGNIVIDKSSYFRYQADVPLIVPEVNKQAVQGYKQQNIIANPNCTTIPIVMALKPLYDAVGITRMDVATYQSVSGSGKEGIVELSEQATDVLHAKPVHAKVYPQQIAFNVIPHIDDFEANGYTREEMKIVWEVQKILGDSTIAINPTAVRVPVFYGHSAAVHIETKKKLSAEQAIALLQQVPGVKVMTGEYPYPTPAREAAGNDLVYVGRVREDIASPLGLNFWVVTDNIRKGAALNAIQIAELLISSGL